MKIASSLAEKTNTTLAQAQAWIRDTLELAARVFAAPQTPKSANIGQDKGGYYLTIATSEKKFRRYYK